LWFFHASTVFDTFAAINIVEVRKYVTKTKVILVACRLRGTRVARGIADLPGTGNAIADGLRKAHNVEWMAIAQN
jgi:hypothetical protein